MSDKKQQVLPPYASRLPATQPPPKPSLPVLPSSSGSFWGSPTTLVKKDSAYVVAHTELLRARSDQAVAMRELVESREQLAIAISKLHALPEICAHHYELGRRNRRSELRLGDLKHQTEEVHAEIQLAAARLARAQYDPQPQSPPPPPTPSVPVGLTPAEVDEAIAALPEISDDMKKTISYILTGRLKEKTG